MIESAAVSYRLTAKVRLPQDTTVMVKPAEERMVGKSSAMRNVFKAIGRAAATELTVLIRGEPGTGKELVARALYSHSAARSKQPFVVVSCAGIAESLLESELFGHEKGVFAGVLRAELGALNRRTKARSFSTRLVMLVFHYNRNCFDYCRKRQSSELGEETLSRWMCE